MQSQLRTTDCAGERPLFFLHIRKTAGVSVRTALFNRFSVAGSLLNCHHVANRNVDPSHYQFVTGHVGFDYLSRFARRPVVFTVLRRPIERALSAYYFFRGHDRAYLQWLRDNLPAEEGAERVRFTQRANELTLVDFLQQESELAQSLLGNLQARSLLGPVRLEQDPRTEGEVLAEALRNLGACDVVGLTERLDESLAVLGHRLGWEGVGPAPRDNVSKDRPATQDVDPQALDILHRWNRLDEELYRVAEGLFQDKHSLMKREAGGSRGRTCEVSHGSAFSFDQPHYGFGWYPREKHEDIWLCWMGAERQAWIDLQAPGDGDHVLQCRGVRALRPSVIDGLQVRVNGSSLVTYKQKGSEGIVLEARIPARLLKADTRRLRIAFEVRETFRPCDLVPGTPDWRTLGIALSSIRVTSAA